MTIIRGHGEQHHDAGRLEKGRRRLREENCESLALVTTSCWGRSVARAEE